MEQERTIPVDEYLKTRLTKARRFGACVECGRSTLHGICKDCYLGKYDDPRIVDVIE